MSFDWRGGAGVSRYLTYHEIVPTAPRYLYSVSAGQFANHVKLIVKMNAREVPVAGMARLTFDDGHISQFEYALPVLESSAIKAIFFVTAGWTGARHGFMSWAQLAKLHTLGHEVQSHGWSHALLTQCGANELQDELSRSKGELESRLGVQIDAISAPGGRCDSRVLEACAKAGYSRVFVSDPWQLPCEKGGVLLAGRWMVTRQMDAAKIAPILGGKGLGIQRAKYLAKETAKKLIGDRAYQKLWQKLSRKQETLENSVEGADSGPA